MSARAAARNLHGSAPDRSPVVLLVIDAINDFDFDCVAARQPEDRRRGRR